MQSWRPGRRVSALPLLPDRRTCGDLEGVSSGLRRAAVSPTKVHKRRLSRNIGADVRRQGGRSSCNAGVATPWEACNAGKAVVPQCAACAAPRCQKAEGRACRKRYTLSPTSVRRPKAPKAQKPVGQTRAWQGQHQRCVGCENQGRPGRSGRPIQRQERWGNRRRGTRRRGAAAALERRAVRREPQAVVRSTLPEATTAVSAVMRTRLPGAVRSEVRERSAGARARAETPARPVVHGTVRSEVRGEASAGDAGQGERGEDGDERGAQRRREENPAVERTMRSSRAAGVPGRQRR